MARVKKIQEEAPSDWQTIFCSLAIILVAFFVMLSSYATLEKGKIVEVSRSFKGALDILEGGVLFEKGEGIVVPSPDKYSRLLEKVAAPIYEILKGRGLEEKIKLKSTNEFVSLTMLDSVLFTSGSADLADTAKTILLNIAGILAGLNVPVRVEGHTDDRSDATGTFRSNWDLSAMRAVNVMRFLQEQGGIDQKRLSAAGYAQYRPFLPNRTDEERTRNRRVEIIIPITEEFFDTSDTIKREAPPSFKLWDLSG